MKSHRVPSAAKIALSYSEAILGEGAAILADGEPMRVHEVVATLNAFVAEIERLNAALDRIAATTGSDDPCRHLVQIARDTLTK